MTPNPPTQPVAACPLCHATSPRSGDEEFAAGTLAM